MASGCILLSERAPRGSVIGQRDEPGAGLQVFKKDLARRRWSLVAYFLLPVAIGMMLVVFALSGADTTSWPQVLFWLIPAPFVLMVVWALRELDRTSRFWLSLGPRLVDARYYATGRYAAATIGVAAIFDNRLVLVEWLGLRFQLFLSDSLTILAPTPDQVYRWFYHSQRTLVRTGEREAANPLSPGVRRIREALGGREPSRLASKLELLLTERTRPVDGWPEVRFSISLGVSIPMNSRNPSVFTGELDDIARFLSESATTMFRMHQKSEPITERLGGA